MGFKYEVTTSAGELKRDETFMKYLLLDGLRSQAEILRISAQRRLLGRQFANAYMLRDRAKAEIERQAQDRDAIEALARKYGRHIILAEAAPGPDNDQLHVSYRGVDFDDAVLELDTPSGATELPYADTKLDPVTGMAYTLAYQVAFPEKFRLTPAEYQAHAYYLPPAPALPS